MFFSITTASDVSNMADYVTPEDTGESSSMWIRRSEDPEVMSTGDSEA